MQQQQVVWNDDHRYPMPDVHAAPKHITGLPTQQELDAMTRLFTWGELKAMISSSELELLSRNKELQARYATWLQEQKRIYGSTENYLIHARLPWPPEAPPTPPDSDHSHSPETHHFIRGPEPTWDQRTALDHPEVDLTPSTNPVPKLNLLKIDTDLPSPAPGAGNAAVAAHALGTGTPSRSASIRSVNGNAYSHVATAATTPAHSGASTPSSVGFVSLESVLPRLRKLKHKRQQSGTSGESGPPGPGSAGSTSPVTASTSPDFGPVHEDDGDDEEDFDVYLKYDPESGLDCNKYAVLPNDWPYCVPYGVRHYCVWSRVPIAHPVLVDYDPVAWARIEEDGLGGFTGVTPVVQEDELSAGDEMLGAVDQKLDNTKTNAGNMPGGLANGHKTPTRTSTTGKGGLQTPPNGLRELTKAKAASGKGRSGPSTAGKGGWYAVDVEYGGTELRRWAGVTYESAGGQEVGKMVRGLWDPRGWETIWFVNPPRLQSVPGFSHFHIFARRKTPEEIDTCEKIWGTGKLA